MSDEFDPSDIPIEVLEMQRKLFREKFGRDPGPGDPIFFDPDADEPIQIDEGKAASRMLKSLQAAGAPGHIIYAYKRTGRILVESMRDNYPDHIVKEYNAAIAEYWKSHPEEKKAHDEAVWRELHHYAFEGTIEGNVTFELCGQSVTRMIRVRWKHTPHWEHYDPQYDEIVPKDEARERSMFRPEIFVKPLEDLQNPDENELADPENQPHWEELDFMEWGILDWNMMEALDDVVDRLCRDIDIDRRKNLEN